MAQKIFKLGSDSQPVRCNFPCLSTPKGTKENPEDLKYSITVFLDKKKDKNIHADLVAFIKQEINACGEWPAAKKKKIENELLIHVNGDMLNKFAVIKDGDALNRGLVEEDKLPRVEQAGKWVVSIRNRRAPQVVDGSGKEILGALIDSSIKSGYWVIVALSVYAWSKKESSGATIQLQGVQRVRKDAEFGRTDCAFEAVPGADDDDDDVTTANAETFED